uniref:Uncharacterized protein n=1 Tax=Acrobeloides nanus TaxID=290746 RepID=A0A914E767_9BILA
MLQTVMKFDVKFIGIVIGNSHTLHRVFGYILKVRSWSLRTEVSRTVSVNSTPMQSKEAKFQMNIIRPSV